MTLDEFLSKRTDSDAAFGEKVGLSQSQISRLRRNLTSPSWKTIMAISTATGGKVTAKDWEASAKAKAKVAS